MAHTDTTEITDSAAITRTLAALRDSGERATMRRAGEAAYVSAALVEVKASLKRLVWAVAPGASALACGAGDRLDAEALQRAGYLFLQGLVCTAVERPEPDGSIRLSTGWPGRLVLQQTRGEWRARLLPDEMPVSARLTQPELPPINGWLRDFSTGGCRIALAPESRAPEPGSDANVRLFFENGEMVVLGGRVSHLTQDRSEFGVTFVGESEEMARHLSWLSREIDREFERNRQVRGELRPLAPSPLFMPAQPPAGD